MSDITREYLEAENEERKHYGEHVLNPPKNPMPQEPPELILTPESSNIKSISWHPYAEVEGAKNKDEGNLYIVFKSDKTYKYFDVSRETWEAFKAAPSKGKFCNKEIVRGGYKFRRL